MRINVPPDSPPRPSAGSRLLAAPFLAAVVFAAGPAPAPSRAATPPQVEQSIARAMDFLRKQQQDGNWEMVPTPPADPLRDQGETRGSQYGGPTALAAYALLAGGESPQSPVIGPAVKLLLAQRMPGVYAAGVRAQVWGFLPQKPDVKAAVQRDGKLLREAVRAKGDARGLYYYVAGDGDQYDHSVSQFGVLGMWALQDLGLEVSTQFWRESDKAWRAHQLPDGAWCYINGGDGDQRKAFPAMTAAGVATLFITQDFVHAAEFTACRGNATDANIEKGLKWMGDNFARVFEGGHDNQGCHYYALYGVERIGVAAGRKYLGATNWYEAGADWLVQHQNPDGSWAAATTNSGARTTTTSSTPPSACCSSPAGAPRS